MTKIRELEAYTGKVVLVVNVASKCGLTPQYAALEKLYQSRRDDGLVILGYPAGNFREQEFDTDAEIAQFCEVNYGVSFPIMPKISVAGADQHPLYKALTEAIPEGFGADEFRTTMSKHKVPLASLPEILWNFEKFLVNKSGEVAARYAPGVTPDDWRLVAAIDAALKE
jgi:glutathione peroxidase